MNPNEVSIVLHLNPNWDCEAIVHASMHSACAIPDESLYLVQSENTKQYGLMLIRDHWEQGNEKEREYLATCDIPEAIARYLCVKYPVEVNCEENAVNKRSVPVTLDKLIAKLNDDIPFEHDVGRDLAELRSCLNVNAYRASLAMCGRILELSLKTLLQRAGHSPNPDLMVGGLLKQIADMGLYADGSLNNTFNIINQQRICGVHHKEKVPVPSEDQALGVAHHTCDTVMRVLEMSPSTQE